MYKPEFAIGPVLAQVEANRNYMIPISKPCIGEAEKAAVMEVLDSGMLAQGPRTAKFEERFAQVCGVKHAIATSSGTTALNLALLAHGIGPGDEVITTPFTFIASANSILFTGAKPVFVDIDEGTFNLNPALIEQALTPRTKAILPVHLYGYMCDMDAIQAIADKHGLEIIEDACQAIGAAFKGRPAGSFGTGTFSLHATKNITSGEGGMVTTNDEAMAERCRVIRNHGMKRRDYQDMLGYNFRMTDLHAAIGLAQLERLGEFTEKRQANASYFNAHIKSVITPKVKDGYDHVWHQYTIRMDGGRDRDAAVKQLNEAGIGTGIFYPVPVHKQAYMREQINGDITLPVAERLAQEVISLPVHPLLSPSDLETIVREVNQL
jgi:perosamine synthetase